jgi:hypothetical protein
MTGIGPGSLGAMNVIGSFAGAQRRDGEMDRVKAEAAGRKFQIDQKAMSARSLGDLAETELSTDRDADGRLPYTEAQTRDRQGHHATGDESRPRRASDPLEESGGLLDLEA